MKYHQLSRSKSGLRVTNLPGCVNDTMLRCIFGPYGSVNRIVLIDSLLTALIEYDSEDGAQKALTHSKQRGINLRSRRLCVNPVNQPGEA